MQTLWAGKHLDGYLIISIDGTSPNEKVFFSMRGPDCFCEAEMNEKTTKLIKTESIEKAVDVIMKRVDQYYIDSVLVRKEIEFKQGMVQIH